METISCLHFKPFENVFELHVFNDIGLPLVILFKDQNIHMGLMCKEGNMAEALQLLLQTHYSGIKQLFNDTMPERMAM